jgi:hypothetical protein
MALQQLGAVLPRVAFEVGERALPQIDSIIEFLNPGDFGRLVSCCRCMRINRQIHRLRLSALERCSMNLARTAGMLAEEWDYGLREEELDSLLGFFGQVDQG